MTDTLSKEQVEAMELNHISNIRIGTMLDQLKATALAVMEERDAAIRSEKLFRGAARNTMEDMSAIQGKANTRIAQLEEENAALRTAALRIRGALDEAALLSSPGRVPELVNDGGAAARKLREATECAVCGEPLGDHIAKTSGVGCPRGGGSWTEPRSTGTTTSPNLPFPAATASDPDAENDEELRDER